MDERGPDQLQKLRAAVLAAEVVARKAGVRLADARLALKARIGTPGEDAARARVAEAEAEERASADALQAAQDERDNAREEADEAANDDPIPQSDYRFPEIVAKLHQGLQRATYAAVAQLLDARPQWVRRWLRGDESRKTCFIVERSSGRPTEYPAACIHPSLESSPTVLSTGDELLAWLQRTGFVFKR